MDRTVFYFSAESAFRHCCFKNVSTFPYFPNYVSRQGKSMNRRNESTKTQVLLLFLSTEDNTQYRSFPSLYYQNC